MRLYYRDGALMQGVSEALIQRVSEALIQREREWGFNTKSE